MDLVDPRPVFVEVRRARDLKQRCAPSRGQEQFLQLPSLIVLEVDIGAPFYFGIIESPGRPALRVREGSSRLPAECRPARAVKPASRLRFERVFTETKTRPALPTSIAIQMMVDGGGIAVLLHPRLKVSAHHVKKWRRERVSRHDSR